MFDLDKDGKISYKDFSKAIGGEIHPSETLYFRQAKLKDNEKSRSNCIDVHCCQAAVGTSKYCSLHELIYQDEMKKIFKKILYKAGDKKWNEFKFEVRKIASPEDNFHVVGLDDFKLILEKVLNIKLTSEEEELFINTCGKVINDTQVVDINYINNIKINQ